DDLMMRGAVTLPLSSMRKPTCTEAWTPRSSRGTSGADCFTGFGGESRSAMDAERAISSSVNPWATARAGPKVKQKRPMRIRRIWEDFIAGGRCRLDGVAGENLRSLPLRCSDSESPPHYRL